MSSDKSYTIALDVISQWKAKFGSNGDPIEDSEPIKTKACENNTEDREFIKLQGIAKKKKCKCVYEFFVCFALFLPIQYLFFFFGFFLSFTTIASFKLVELCVFFIY